MRPSAIGHRKQPVGLGTLLLIAGVAFVARAGPAPATVAQSAQLEQHVQTVRAVYNMLLDTAVEAPAPSALIQAAEQPLLKHIAASGSSTAAAVLADRVAAFDAFEQTATKRGWLGGQVEIPFSPPRASPAYAQNCFGGLDCVRTGRAEPFAMLDGNTARPLQNSDGVIPG